MCSLLTQYRFYRVLNFLTINVTDVGTLFGRTGGDILPSSYELSIGQGTTISVSYNKIRLRVFLSFAKTFGQSLQLNLRITLDTTWQITWPTGLRP